MRHNPFKSFFPAIIVSIVIIGVVYLCFFFMIFNLGGGETLSQIENQNIAQLIISILLLTIAIYYAKRYFNRNIKYTAYGILVFPVIIFLATTIYFWGHNFYQKFDKTIWVQSKRKPERMAKTLVKGKTLIGLTGEQVKAILGEGSAEYGSITADRGTIEYLVENHWTLIIVFQNDKVAETRLRLPWLGI